MTMTRDNIDRVPPSITREQYLAVVTLLGFDVADVVELRLSPEGVYATIKSKTEAGSDMIGPGGNEIAKHTIFVEVPR